MSADKTHMQAGVTNLYSFVGSLNKAFLVGIDENTLLGGVPEYILIIFGMTFAIITPVWP
jgi:Amt family ammonium transporter